MNFYIETLGCKVNQYESEMMAELLKSSGHSTAESMRDAELCIVNSCTVTATGDAKCRKLLRRIRRENPTAILVLCGCMPQAFSDQPEVFDDCDIVMGNTARRDIVPILERYLRDRRQIIQIDPHKKDEAFEPMRVSSFDDRTRAFVKIEDGCNRFCTYCIIPYARGRVRSKPVDTLYHEALQLAANGYQEIVLVGINLSAYGQDIGADIFDAVHAVCSVPGVERVRLGSIEPERMTREMLLKLASEEKFCPHFHLSLQSGSDSTLKRMRRHYDTAEYKRIVGDIRELFDNPAVTTDVMVGFVGETEDEFAESLAYCAQIGFAKAHVFPYSIRKGTVAEHMDGHIDEHTKHIRAEIMIEHTLRSQRDFMQSQTGKRSRVLIETTDARGVSEGYTPNYTKVKIAEALPSGVSFDVLITAAHDDYCEGVVVR